MRRFFNRVRAFLADDSGVTASEYAVTAALEATVRAVR